MIERLKLEYRTFRYQYRDDVGGMYFIKKNVQPGDTVFDIGAHKGGYLNAIRKCVGKLGTVVGFEPQSFLYDYLISIKKSLHWSNVTIERLALSDKTGKSNLYIPANKVKQDSSPEASLLESKSERNINRIEEVNTQTLDNYVKQYNLRPAFLKIDVEGNELNIFKGGTELLNNLKPKIIVEIEARHVGKEKAMETFDFLTNLNYSGKFIHKKEFIGLDKFSFARHQNTDNMDDYCNNFIFE